MAKATALAEETQVEKPKHAKVYNVRLLLTEELLGSSPMNPEVYKRFIAAKMAANKNLTPEEISARTEEELNTLTKEREESGWSVFHSDEQGLFEFDYVMRGFLKAAAESVFGKEISAYKSKIDKWVFITPRRIYLQRDGATLKKADDVCERPLRAMTMQGPRVSLKRSDSVNPGTSLEFQIVVLPLGQREFNEDRLRSMLDYGQWSALGEWRNASKGRFTYEMTVKE